MLWPPYLGLLLLQGIDGASVTGVCVGRGGNGAHVTGAQGEGLHELSRVEAGMCLAEDPITLAISTVTKLQMPLGSQNKA